MIEIMELKYIYVLKLFKTVGLDVMILNVELFSA